MAAPTANEPKDPKSKIDDKAADNQGLNNPEMSKEGKITKKAVSDAKQAWEICKGLRKRGEDFRIKRNATIMAKYGGEAPFDQKALNRAQQNWRNNFSTGFIASIVDRIRPQFLDALRRAKTLLNARLPKSFKDATRKENVFNAKISKTIRSWTSWVDFLNLLTQEDVLIGYASVVWLDKSEDEWRPWLFRSDEAFFPDGTAQHSSRVPCFMIEQELLIYEFVEPLANRQAAEAAGYNYESCIKLVNKDQTPPEKTEIDRQDAIREGRFEDSFKVEAKTITVFHLLVREYDGGVDLWTVEKTNGDEVRYFPKLHEDMENATVLFTLQTGNNKLYGSKGLGRSLVNLHIAIERGRCLAADQMYLSGLVLLSCPEKDINRVMPVVRHPFVLVPDSVEIAVQNIDFNADSFNAMDSKLVEIAESIAGSFIPPQVQENTTPNTKIEAAAKVERQEKVKQNVLSRFNGQFSELVRVMKRKICSALNMREANRVFEDRKRKRKGALVVVPYIVFKWVERVFSKSKKELQAVAAYESKIADREAVECLVEMLEEGLTVEEIGMLRESTEAESFTEEGPEEDQNTLTWITNNLQNPRMNMDEATAISAEIMLTRDRAERLVIGDEVDQTIKAEAQRMQILEFGEFMDGNPVPVSPRDNHPTHRETLLPLLEKLMKVVMSPAVTPALITAAKISVEHYGQHLQLDPLTEGNPESAKKEEAALVEIEKAIAEAEKAMQAMIEEQGGGDPANLPIPVPGQPPQVDPATAQIVGEEKDRETGALKDAADLALRKTDQEQRQQELDMQREQQEHQRGLDVTNTQLEAARITSEADAAKEAAKAARETKPKK